MLMVKGRRSNGKIKICGIHDVMREFCLKEAHRENFLQVIDDNYHQLLRTDQLNLTRVSFHSCITKYMTTTDASTSFIHARSLFCFEKLGPTDLKGCSGMYFKLLKIFDASHVHLLNLPVELSSLTRLRYLAVTIQNHVYVSVLFKLQDLQALLVRCEWDGHLPDGFWKMPELRHLYLKGNTPSTLAQRVPTHNDQLTDLPNLRSLSTIRPVDCTKEVFVSMPNLKKLGIYETEEDYNFRGWPENLVILEELETLKYTFYNPFARSNFRDRHPSWGIFPPKLMKLTLSGTSLPWENMVHLNRLSSLEVLKLKNCAFLGPIWKTAEMGFRCLKYLLIGSTNLKIWEANRDHFPKLQHLVLRNCRSLTEIPIDIGFAPMLQKIELHSCGDAAADSARKLQKEQCDDWGNDTLIVYITKGQFNRSNDPTDLDRSNDEVIEENNDGDLSTEEDEVEDEDACEDEYEEKEAMED